MATKPLSSEAIAITEKKMDMSLDDIIKMSRTSVTKSKKQRPSNKSRKFFNGNQDKSQKMRQYLDSRSTLRQGVLAQRRSIVQGKSFPVVSEAARRAAVAPFRNRAVNRNRAAIWNKPRSGGPLRRQGNPSDGGNASKQAQPKQRGEMVPKQKPKTLDSLFADMKEERMRTFTSKNNGGGANRGRGFSNQPRQPWLRGRFGNYRN